MTVDKVLCEALGEQCACKSNPCERLPCSRVNDLKAALSAAGLAIVIEHPVDYPTVYEHHIIQPLV